MKNTNAQNLRKSSKKFNRRHVDILLVTRGIRTPALARAIGISPSYMYDLLTGRRPAGPYLQKVANLLGVSPAKIAEPALQIPDPLSTRPVLPVSVQPHTGFADGVSDDPQPDGSSSPAA